MPDIEDVRRLIRADSDLSTLWTEVERLVGDEAEPGHDLGHVLRVAAWTLELGGSRVASRNAIAAALLHDVVNPSKDDPTSAQAGAHSAEIARDLLPAVGFDPSAVGEIAEAIEDHSYSRGALPASNLGRALQDADRLDALGSIGVFRTLACGVRMGAAFYDAKDPWAERRPLDDRRFTLDHFFNKLLKLPQTLHTEKGRVEAERRVATMERFLRRLSEEIGVPVPELRLPRREARGRPRRHEELPRDR